VSSLRQLPEDLYGFPPYAVCCQLANIQPVNTRDSNTADWSQPATDYLKSAMSKLLTAHLDDSLPVGAFVRYDTLHQKGHVHWRMWPGANLHILGLDPVGGNH